MFYTYILKSDSYKKTYVGHTNDINKRIDEHNCGKSIFSRRYRPWKLIYKEEFLNEAESIKKEKYFKSRTGRRWIKKHLFADVAKLVHAHA